MKSYSPLAAPVEGLRRRTGTPEKLLRISIRRRTPARVLVSGVLVLVGLFVGRVFDLQAQSIRRAAVKENLDLPYNGGLVARDSILFYGSQFEIDGIFYVIDRSGSMQDRGELRIAKREIARNIMEISDDIEFAIVFFDLGIVKFPDNGRPAKASAQMRSAAISWLSAVAGGRGSCVQQGLAEGLNFANRSVAQRKVILYVGDGGGTCNGSNEQNYLTETLALVRSLNFQRARVNTIGVLMQGRAVQEEFLKVLATTNGGTYYNKDS